ncbi:MAG: DNA ligase D [Acidobacteria bacterium]|nr:DNA ligase D [Acidobacteriota bacterium]
MPASVAPMKSTLVTQAPTGEDWLFEIKWDGVRALGFLDDQRLRLISRNGRSCERQYPELGVVPHFMAARQAILDSEIVTLDEKGISRFELIQPRIANSDAGAIARLARSRPVVMYAFDLLYLDGWDLRQVALIERKRLLEQILRPCPVLRYSEHVAGGGQALLEAAREAGLEGVLAKRAASGYEPRRSREWLKIKIVQQQEFLVCGFTEGEREYFSALVLGAGDQGGLAWVGNVGTGFDQKSLRELFERLQPLEQPRSPFAQKTPIPRVRWVRPELVAMIKFANWTQDGRLRAPVYLGLRSDVDPRDVVRELPAAPQAPVSPAEEPLLTAAEEEAVREIDGRKLKFTNLNKIFYPAEGYTKRDLVNHYDAVAELILPHLKDRPLSLKRYPNGIEGKFFFQKNAPASFPSWLRFESVYSEHNQAPIRFVLAEDRASLLYLANLGCIDQNPWMSRVGSLENPDFMLIDLDPQECSFEKVVEAAQLVRRALDPLGLEGYPKTTGGDGLHVYIPVAPEYTYEQTKTFAELIARIVIAEKPDLFTTPRALEKRQKGRVYFDYLQNGYGKTIAAPYVLRAYPGAPVATPLDWGEVARGLDPRQFHIRNAPQRFARVGDLFAPVLANRQRLEKPLEKMQSLLKPPAHPPKRR